MDAEVIVLSAQENATTFIDLANAYLKENNVLDSEGNQAFFTPTAASPAWIFALAHGSMYSDWQARQRDAVLAFSVENCSDAQVLNLAQIAGLSRNTGRSSTTMVVFKAIPSGTLVVEEGDVYVCNDVRWIVDTSGTCSDGATMILALVSEERGAFSVVADQTFVPVVANANIATALSNGTGTLGNGYETLDSLRQRIINQEASAGALEKATTAIEALDGVVYCRIYFNSALTETMTLPGGELLAPRTAIITIFGTDTDNLIGETFYAYAAVPTTGVFTSSYRTYSGQLIDVAYNKATTTTVQAKIIVEAGTALSGYQSYLRDALILASGSLTVGENYSSQYLSTYLKDFEYATVLGVYLWNTTTSAWDVTTDLAWNTIALFTKASITIEEV